MASGRKLFSDFRDTHAPVSQEARAGKHPAPSVAQRAQFSIGSILLGRAAEASEILKNPEWKNFSEVIDRAQSIRDLTSAIGSHLEGDDLSEWEDAVARMRG